MSASPDVALRPLAVPAHTHSPAAGDEIYVLRHYRSGDEAAIVDLLNSVFPGGWGKIDDWMNRHAGRPDFDVRDIVVAERGGTIVACLHSAVFETYAGGGVTIRMATDGDLAVHAEHRSSGVAERLYSWSEESLRSRGVALRTGYSEATTRVHYYCRVMGYITGFDRTAAWNKQLDAGPIRDRLLRLLGSSPEAPDPGRGPVVEIAITGLSPFRLRLRSRNIALSNADPDITIAMDQQVLALFARGSRKRVLLDIIRSRSVRFRGLLTGAPRILFWAIRSLGEILPLAITGRVSIFPMRRPLT